MDAHWTSTHVPQQSPETDAAVLVLLFLTHPLRTITLEALL